jgi:V/A-type H+-transporting ATPase subunit C
MVDWGYCSGRLRSLENYLLTYNLMLRWSEANSRDNFSKYVADSFYGDEFKDKAIEDYETVFENHILALYKEIEGYIPDDTLLKIHKLIYDANNIKIIFKAKITGGEINWEVLSENGKYPPEELYTMIEEKLYRKFPSSVEKALRFAEEEYKRTGNIQVSDFIIDNGVNDYRFELLNKPGYESVRGYYSKWVDLENIKNLIRSKRMNFDRSIYALVILNGGNISDDYFLNLYGLSLNEICEEIKRGIYGEFLEAGISEFVSTKNFSKLEKLMDEYLVKAITPFKYVAEGPEVLEEFLSMKKLELKNLKIVFIGKLNDMPSEKITQRIRNNGI